MSENCTAEHRAVSPPGEQRGGGPHRDVPDRRFRVPGGGHHRGVVGQQGFSRHHQRAEQESLRPHRGLAESPLARQALSIRLRGRHIERESNKSLLDSPCF